MSADLPLVSVVIPARNEARDIEECLAAVAGQDYPLERIEVIVVDGASTDATRERAEKAMADVPFARAVVIENVAGTTPSNLNRALSEATGSYLCRVDARSVVPPQYVRTCVETLATRPDIAVVGGAQVAAVPATAGVVARGIARALRNPYATGLARYRRSANAGATDTVYLGAFRTHELATAGGWDERFLTNQDFELNARLGHVGHVWFDPRLAVRYRPRSDLQSLARQYFRFGRWKGAAWLEAGVPLSARQAVLLVAPPAAAVMATLGARRNGRATVAAGTVAALLLDAQVREPAPPAERVAGVVATGVISIGWWCGVVAQAMSAMVGEGLIQQPLRRATTR